MAKKKREAARRKTGRRPSGAKRTSGNRPQRPGDDGADPRHGEARVLEHLLSGKASDVQVAALGNLDCITYSGGYYSFSHPPPSKPARKESQLCPVDLLELDVRVSKWKHALKTTAPPPAYVDEIAGELACTTARRAVEVIVDLPHVLGQRRYEEMLRTEAKAATSVAWGTPEAYLQGCIALVEARFLYGEDLLACRVSDLQRSILAALYPAHKTTEDVSTELRINSNTGRKNLRKLRDNGLVESPGPTGQGWTLTDKGRRLVKVWGLAPLST